MKIALKSIIPDPLPISSISESEIWREQIEFNQGESILAHAPSGKGKSTFLHLIYGLRKDFSGSFILGDFSSKTIGQGDWESLRAQKISILFQDLRLFSHLTARENLSLLPALSDNRPPIEEMCQQLNIGSLLEQKVCTLSHGQRQRFALIRSLLKPITWLLLDEPFSHLDEKNTEAAVHLIEQIRAKEKFGLIQTSLSKGSFLSCDRTIRL